MALFSLLAFCTLSFSQSQEGEGKKSMSVKPELGFEYFSRTITWDDDQYSSKLKSLFLTLTGEYEITEGFTISAKLGYSLSNYDALAFRQLPISVELDVDSIKGYLFGSEIKVKLINIGNFEIFGYGEFVFSFGSYEEWEVEGLNIQGGTVTGRPSWKRGKIGPQILYKKYNNFFPYLSIHYNKLWGTFKIEEEIQDLEGEEEKSIKSKSSVDLSIGSLYQPTRSIIMRVEASVLPHPNGIDLGIMTKISFSF